MTGPGCSSAPPPWRIENRKAGRSGISEIVYLMASRKAKITVVSAAVILLAGLSVIMAFHINARSPNHSQAVGDLTVTVECIPISESTPEFKFKTIPRPNPAKTASSAVFSLLTGGQDFNGANLQILKGGSLPYGPDVPDQNFFFGDGSFGGRILVDLQEAIDIGEINSYSWHTSNRAPQLYILFASDGLAAGFNPQPDRGVDLVAAGWKLLANVDTRPKTSERGGQYGVSIASRSGVIGHFRYLLFDCKRTEGFDRWGNTFYSEIDIIPK